jgi:hypothetical protein
MFPLRVCSQALENAVICTEYTFYPPRTLELIAHGFRIYRVVGSKDVNMNRRVNGVHFGIDTAYSLVIV